MDRRRNAIYIIVVISLLAGLITGRSFFFNVAYAFGGLLLFSFVWSWVAVNWLRLNRRTGSRRTQVGRTIKEAFTVVNTAVLPKLWLEIYDSSTLPGHHASHVVSNIGANKRFSWEVQTLCTRRGEYRLGPMRVVSGDPFGLFQSERRLQTTTQLVVYPQTVDLQNFTTPVGVLSGGDALRRRATYVTTNAAGVRDYAPGDSFSRIHWRSTARKGRLIVKEFELDPMSDVWIMLDSERAVHAGQEGVTVSPAGYFHNGTNGTTPLDRGICCNSSCVHCPVFYQS